MTDRDIDEVMYVWPRVIRHVMAGSDDWLKGFAKSIARHGKRAGWKPTPKQWQLMRRLVSEAQTHADASFSPIEV